MHEKYELNENVMGRQVFDIYSLVKAQVASEFSPTFSFYPYPFVMDQYVILSVIPWFCLLVVGF